VIYLKDEVGLTMVEVLIGKKAPIKDYRKNERRWIPTDLGTKIKA
jgi:hypothetical protein